MANCKDIVNYNNFTKFVFRLVSSFIDEKKLDIKTLERLNRENEQWKKMTFDLKREIGKEEISQDRSNKWDDMSESLRKDIGTEEINNFKKDPKK